MNKKRLFLSKVFIICMLAMLYLAGIIMSKIGILRDEYGITGKNNLLTTSENIIIICLPISIIILNIITLLLTRLEEKVLYFVLFISVCGILVSAVSMVKINTRIADFEPKKIEFEELTLDTLNNFIDDKKSGIIYVKRDDCAKCTEMDEYLNNIICKKNNKIYVYSTSKDRDTNSEEMYKFLDSIEVTYVPIILVSEDGIIQKTFSFNTKAELKKILNAT